MGKHEFYTYQAKIISVYDGDTCTAVIDLGFRISFEIKLRLAGINTPELRGEERDKGLEARDFLGNLILNQKVVIKTYKDSQEKYGRYLADIYFIDSSGNQTHVNQNMVDEGYAKPYQL